MVNVHRQEMADDVVHEQRTVIKFYVKLGKNMHEIKEDLQKVYGDSRFTNSCILKWFHRFSDGRKSVKDDPPPPLRPKSNSKYGQKNCCNRRICYER